MYLRILSELCYNETEGGEWVKNKKIYVVLIVILAVVLLAVFSKPVIEKHNWQLYSVSQTDAPYFTVAHKSGNSNSNMPFADFSKPVDIVLEAKSGKLTLTDKTNSKTYTGTYKLTSIGYNRQNQHYDVVIDGKAGSANVSFSDGTLVMFLPGYSLIFDIK